MNSSLEIKFYDEIQQIPNMKSNRDIQPKKRTPIELNVFECSTVMGKCLICIQLAFACESVAPRFCFQLFFLHFNNRLEWAM